MLTSATSTCSTRAAEQITWNKRGESSGPVGQPRGCYSLLGGHAKHSLWCNAWTNEGSAFPSLLRRRDHGHKHREYVLDTCCGAQSVERAWRAPLPLDSHEIIPRWWVATLSVFDGTDRRTRGTSSLLFSAFVTTTTSTTGSCLTHAT
jgi:hypothetical protein